MRAIVARALSLCLVMAAVACTDDNPDTAELSFHGEQKALPGFTYDTGFQPTGGPIQVRFELTAVGKLEGKASGSISDTALVGKAGTGQYALDTRIKVKAFLKMDVAGKKYNGALPGAPEMALTFGDKATFDPFLLGQKTSVTGSFPETKLGTINLAGALSAIPGVKGDLVISAAGTVTSEFTGVCAAVTGDLAQFTGNTSTSGTLTLKPSVEIKLPLGVSKKLAPFEIKVPIPATTAAMDLGTRSISGGTVSGKGPCSGAPADGGPGDGAQNEGGLLDGAKPVDGAKPIDGPSKDTGVTDGPPPEQACTTGTPDNCAFCGDKCLGPDNSGTQRACISGACTIQCKGDNYDVNGKVSDGCELVDPLAQNSTLPAAKDLGTASDCDSAKKTTAAVLSDSRHHLKAPSDRKLGQPYYFKLAISDKTWCALSATTTVNLSALPKAAKYGVTAHWVCKKDNKVLKSTTKSAYGGKSMTLNPYTDCAGTDDSGTLYIKVYKILGASSHSAAHYTLSITP